MSKTKITKEELLEMKKKEVQSLATEEQITAFVSSVIEDVGNYQTAKMRKLITWLTPQQIPLISAKIIPLFTKENQLLLYAFTKEQIQALTEQQIQALTKEQIEKLSSTNFTTEQAFFRGLFALPMAIINALDEGDFILSVGAGLYIENHQVQSLTPQQINWFSLEQLKAFTEKQIDEFNFEQLKAFAKKQNSYFTKEEHQTNELLTFDNVKDNANVIKLSINHNNKIQHCL